MKFGILLSPILIWRTLRTFLGLKLFVLTVLGAVCCLLFIFACCLLRRKPQWKDRKSTCFLIILALGVFIGWVAGPYFIFDAKYTELAMLKHEMRTFTSTEKVQNSYLRLEEELEKEVQKIESLNGDSSTIIPSISFQDIAKGAIDPEMRERIKERGVVILRGVVDRDQADKWRQELYRYRDINSAVGYPVASPQILEVYHSPPQVAARQHPNLALARSFLNRLWTYSNSTDENGESVEYYFDPDRDYTYLDRVRIRPPGESLSLDLHVDSGYIERWSDPGYRLVFDKIFNGDWESYDPYDGKYRTNVQEEEIPNTSTFFRSHQAWLALSQQGPGDGTLQVIPLLRLATAYFLLRPLVSETVPASQFCSYWPTSSLKQTPECYQKLARAKVSIPTVYPGDLVAWHPDVIHSVERYNSGTQDSIAIYIPSSPLCAKNAKYIAKQKESILLGKTPPDFPRLDAEEKYIDRWGVEQLTELGKMQLGFLPWPTSNDGNCQSSHLYSASSSSPCSLEENLIQQESRVANEAENNNNNNKGLEALVTLANQLSGSTRQ